MAGPHLSTGLDPGLPLLAATYSVAFATNDATPSSANKEPANQEFRCKSKAPSLLRTYFWPNCCTAALMIFSPIRKESLTDSGRVNGPPFCTRKSAGRGPRLCTRSPAAVNVAGFFFTATDDFLTGGPFLGVRDCMLPRD